MSMNAKIDFESIGPVQAQRALLLVYDRLPDGAWGGGKKPSLVSFEAFGDDLRDAASLETTPVVEALLGPGHEELKGAAAREALRMLAEDETLRPLVSEAVTRAAKPDAAAFPLVIGACIIAFSLMPKIEVTEKDGHRTVNWVFDPTSNAAVLLDKLTALIKALPPSVVATLAVASVVV